MGSGWRERENWVGERLGRGNEVEIRCGVVNMDLFLFFYMQTSG